MDLVPKRLSFRPGKGILMYGDKRMKERIYVCHTFYNVYVTMLKEFALPKERHGKASIVLSTMSTQFGNLKENLEKSGVFQEVYEMDEKKDIFFPELEKYKKNYQSCGTLKFS